MRSAIGTRRVAYLAVAAIAAAIGQASAKDLTEVVIGVSNFSMNSGPNITAAMELGYFTEEGLAVKIQEFQGGSVVMPQVATKSVPIGSGTGDPLVIASQPGKPRMPIRFFYNMTRDYNWEWVVPENSPIKTIADLKGKTIGVGALTNSHMPVSRMIMKENGLEQAKDYNFIAIGVGGPAFKALLDGQVDAYNTFTANIGAFESQPGVAKLRRLKFNDRYMGLFQNGYFAHEDTIKQNPQILIGFGRALAKGTIVCSIAVEYCIKSYWKYNPNVKPREGSEDDNARRLVVAVQTAWKSFMAFPDGKPKRFGEYPAGSWENLASVLVEGGEVAAKYDTSPLFTNELIDKINDFDVAAVERQAQGLR